MTQITLARRLGSAVGRVLVMALVCCLQSGSPVWAHPIELHHDTIPHFCEDSSRTIIHSARSGAWSDPGTWQGNAVPAANQIAWVDAGHVVTLDTVSALVYGICVDGILRFNPAINTRLSVVNLLVMPAGYLEIGTETTPVAAGVTAELVIRNAALDVTNDGVGVYDPDQYGTGLIVLGKARMHGAVKTPTFVRLAVEPRVGHTTLTFAAPVSGWKAGDQLVLPDTRQEPTEDGTRVFPQVEVMAVQSVAADGRSLTITPALQYNHLGARNPSGTLEFLPHAGNLTRNIVIRSENPSGTRGHTLFTHRADVDLRYVAFKDLGRTTIDPLNDQTNHIGRYPLHIHHLFGPVTTPANGYQFTLLGNSIYDSNPSLSRFKWGLTLHDSHYGLVKDTVLYNIGGAHLVTEDGSESFNVIERNFALRGQGEGDRAGSGFPGAEGIGFWFRGPNNYVRDNVAANLSELQSGVEAAYGFKLFFVYLGNINVPNFKGADTTVAGQYTTRSGNSMPLLEFSGNETYGVIQGLTMWWLCTLDTTPQSCPQSVIKDMRIWHASRYSFYGYPAYNVVFDGLVVRGDPAAIQSDCCEFGSTFFFGDYMNKDITIRNADVQGISRLELPYFGDGTTTVENSYVRTRSGVVNRTSGAPGSCNGCNLPDRKQIIRNLRTDPLPGRAHRAITMDFDTHNGSNDTSSKDEVFVYDYQGQAGNNFRVYYKEQATQNIAGGLAPCNDTTSHPEIDGITCPMSGTPPPSSAPTASLTASPGTITAGQSSTLNWSTGNATTVSINQGIGAVTASGSQTVSPASTTTYTLTATGSGGTTTRTATVTVTAAPPTGNVSVSPASIAFAKTIGGPTPAAQSVTVTVPGGGIWTTFDESPFYDATTQCAFQSCASGSSSTLTPNAAYINGLPAGTHAHALTVRASGFADVTVPVTLVVSNAAPPANQAPGVSAGPDRAVTLPNSASLDGTVSDDGLPGNTLTTLWTKVSGAGTVTFGNASAVDTTASFTSADSYLLRLTGSDGSLQSSDDMLVTVQPAATPPPGGPALGNTAVGPSVDSNDSQFINAIRFAMPGQGGTVTSFSVFIAAPVSAAPNNLFQGAIYTDLNGAPGSLVAASASKAITPDAWNTVTLSASLAANTTYWLAYNTNGTQGTHNNFRVGPGSAGQMKWRAQAFGSWPGTFGTAAGTSDTTASMYAAYTPSQPPSCTPSWSCTAWSACSASGSQTRTCTDASSCGTTTGKPAESQSCTPPPVADTVKPTVSLTAPAAGTVVTRGSWVAMRATAADNVGVVGVDFYRNTMKMCTDTTAPYECSWRVPGSGPSSYNLTARARDAAKNARTTAPVKVTVQ